MNRRQFASTLGAIIALPRTSQTAITSQRTAARSLVGPLAIPQTRATLSDVKHASIADGMALACTMMGNVFNTDDNEIP